MGPRHARLLRDASAEVRLSTTTAPGSRATGAGARWWAALGTLAVLATVVYAWDIAHGVTSEYYAAIVRSMALSWKNFLFGAVDPGGSVSVDKIPGSFWFTALSVRLFGFSTWSLLLPSALATAATVIVVGMAGRRWLGDAAGLAAAGAFSATPIVAAVARSNQPHVIFVLFLALAAERAISALQEGSRRALIASGLWIAVAFHCYMLEAWAIWPAIIVAWLVAAPVPSPKRVYDLLIAGAVSGFASLLWIIIVTLTPASIRPWVGGSNHSSAWEMVFVYNGIGRFLNPDPTTPGFRPVEDPTQVIRGFAAPFGGPAGPGRLLNADVGGQIGWLLPAAIVGLIVVAVVLRRSEAIRPGGLFVAGWFATYGVLFSFSSGIHQFYTAALAPAVALLAVAGVLLGLRSNTRWGRAAATVSVLASAVCAAFLVGRTDDYLAWTVPVQLASGLIAAVTIAAFRAPGRAAAGIVAISIVVGSALTPAAWAIASVANRDPINPIAGPPALEAGHDPGAGGPPDGSPLDRVIGGDPGEPGSATVAEIITYLQEHRDGARYLLATFGAMNAAPFIIATGEPVLPMGGFDGADPFPTVAEMAQFVASGDVRYVLVGGTIRTKSSGSAIEPVRRWIRMHCEPPPDAPTDWVLRCA